MLFKMDINYVLVVLVVDGVGQYRGGRLIIANFHAHGAEADFFGSIADAQQGNAFAVDMTILP